MATKALEPYTHQGANGHCFGPSMNLVSHEEYNAYMVELEIKDASFVNKTNYLSIKLVELLWDFSSEITNINF